MEEGRSAVTKVGRALANRSNVQKLSPGPGPSAGHNHAKGQARKWARSGGSEKVGGGLRRLSSSPSTSEDFAYYMAKEECDGDGGRLAQPSPVGSQCD